jgi:mRNA interferase MazF
VVVRDEIVRGDIWLINLDPTVGSEIQKTRPCVIISPPEMHDQLRTAIIAPMTTGSKPAGFRVAVTHDGKKGLILLDQLRAADKTRLVKKIGSVSDATLTDVLNTLQAVFSI